MATKKLLPSKSLGILGLLIGIFTFFVLSGIVFAQDGPLWSDNTTSVTSGSAYTPERVYNFGINWTNATGGSAVISNVTFETNLTTGSTTLINVTKADVTMYTTFTDDTGIWNISFTQEQFAGAGVYVFRWYANDTANMWNSTDQWVYNITNAATQNYIHLALNGTETNRTWSYPTAVNATGWNDTSVFSGQTGITFTLYRNNGTDEANLGVGTVNDTALWGNGTYNYTYYASGNANFSSTSKTYWLFVNKGQVRVFLNGTEGGRSYTQNQVGNITVYLNNPTTVVVNLTVNFTSGYNRSGNSPLENITTLSYSAGMYNVTGFYEGNDTNLSSTGRTYWLTINLPTTTTTTTTLGGGYTTTTSVTTTTTTTLPPVEERHNVTSAAANTNTTFTFTKSDTLKIQSIIINPKTSLSDVGVSVEESSLPSGASAPVSTTAGKIYKYVKIAKTGSYTDLDLNKIYIKFKVAKSWLTDNNINDATITLYRYYANAWQKLSTEKLSSDTNYFYYQAESAGLSVFAIAGETVVTTTTAPTTTTMFFGIPKKIGPIPTWVIGVIVVIIVVIFVIFFLASRGVIELPGLAEKLPIKKEAEKPWEKIYKKYKEKKE